MTSQCSGCLSLENSCIRRIGLTYSILHITPLNLVLIKKNQQFHSRSQYWNDNEAATDHGRRWRIRAQGELLRKKGPEDRGGGGVACYVAASMVYTRLRYIEDDEYEVLSVRLRPQKLPRKYSCIIIAFIYHPTKADNGSMREYTITSLDTILRCYPECGIILTGDFNQLRDSFLRVHYGYAQLVNVATRNGAILDKIWSYTVCRLYMLTLLGYLNWEHLTTGWFYSPLQAILHWTRVYDSE